MNILIVNQSIIDLCASFFTLMIALVEVDGTHMSRDSLYDQFVCRVWLTRIPLWALLGTSTYGIVIIALERYIAAIYPLWHNVRTNSTIWQCIPYVAAFGHGSEFTHGRLMYFYHPQMQRGNAFGRGCLCVHVCLSVCLSLC